MFVITKKIFKYYYLNIRIAIFKTQLKTNELVCSS
jgi:hypothetical protein